MHLLFFRRHIYGFFSHNNHVPVLKAVRGRASRLVMYVRMLLREGHHGSAEKEEQRGWGSERRLSGVRPVEMAAMTANSHLLSAQGAAGVDQRCDAYMRACAVITTRAEKKTPASRLAALGDAGRACCCGLLLPRAAVSAAAVAAGGAVRVRPREEGERGAEASPRPSQAAAAFLQLGCLAGSVAEGAASGGGRACCGCGPSGVRSSMTWLVSPLAAWGAGRRGGLDSGEDE